MKNDHSYHETKIRPIVKLIARIVKDNPSIVDDEPYFMSTVAANIPGFTDRKKCLNCEASMAEYAQVLDVNDALLLYSMARIVRKRVGRGVQFTEANRVRVSSENIHHTQKCRTTKCSKLGLIAKAGDSNWSITSRGWAGLRGEPVPRMRVTFRGNILERPDELVTFRTIFAEHREKMDDRARRLKSLKDDHRSEFLDYNPSDWVNTAGFHEGQLF